MTTGTNTIHFIARKNVHVHHSAAYGRIVVTIRPEKVESHRVHLAVRRDRTNYSGDKSTPTTYLQRIETLLNSTIFTSNATFSTTNIKDFYHNAPLSTFEYMRLPINIIPEEIIIQYNPHYSCY